MRLDILASVAKPIEIFNKLDETKTTSFCRQTYRIDEWMY